MFSICHLPSSYFLFFFFNDTATTEIYTLSLHDALPICAIRPPGTRILAPARPHRVHHLGHGVDDDLRLDRKSTRLNSSHANISYAVFCLKKKKKEITHVLRRGQESVKQTYLDIAIELHN